MTKEQEARKNAVVAAVAQQRYLFANAVLRGNKDSTPEVQAELAKL